jgi:uncharacterized protein (TIGR00369 family)
VALRGRALLNTLIIEHELMEAKCMDPTANEGVSAFSGLKYFRALMDGSIARSGILKLFDINIVAAEPGLVVLTAIPMAEHYNPMGVVHGGYAAVLLDTCMAAAIVTSLEPGLSPVTLEYKINFTRPMFADTGVVRGEGKTLHVGRQAAIGEGRLLDAKGRLLAHGTTTCHIVRERTS